MQPRATPLRPRPSSPRLRRPSRTRSLRSLVEARASSVAPTGSVTSSRATRDHVTPLGCHAACVRSASARTLRRTGGARPPSPHAASLRAARRGGCRRGGRRRPCRFPLRFSPLGIPLSRFPLSPRTTPKGANRRGTRHGGSYGAARGLEPLSPSLSWRAAPRRPPGGRHRPPLGPPCASAPAGPGALVGPGLAAAVQVLAQPRPSADSGPLPLVAEGNPLRPFPSRPPARPARRPSLPFPKAVTPAASAPAAPAPFSMRMPNRSACSPIFWGAASETVLFVHGERHGHASGPVRAREGKSEELDETSV